MIRRVGVFRVIRAVQRLPGSVDRDAVRQGDAGSRAEQPFQEIRFVRVVLPFRVEVHGAFLDGCAGGNVERATQVSFPDPVGVGIGGQQKVAVDGQAEVRAQTSS
ncbi:hypothetical protein GCM10019016_105010 [Streptomyces prasinosporus]|uniref:Uncharacterized protein n=1 Tax=Streptomyces prasinosporus TaxID=68256 RepID=A0ABP6U6Q7_9ACTN